MGCENSKTVRVQPVGPASVSRDNTKMVEGKEGATQTPELKLKASKLSRRGSSMRSTFSGEYELDEFGNKVKKSNKKRPRSPNTKDLMGSCESLEDVRSMDSDRGFSATSKQSADSGLGEEYAHVITEFSEENKIKEVEMAFKSRDDLELAITGVPVGTKNSAKDRARMEEAQVMQTLREEGLITKPKAEASGGMCFEIVATGAGAPRPPPRLEKLERSRKKKKVPQTEDEIREKLERAERRRKKKEQERLEKLREMERTDAVAALENFAQYQKSKEENLAQRMDQAQDNKERKQRELKEKQERRRRHAEEVRKRKALAKENGSENPEEEEEEEMTSKPEDVSSRRSPLLVAESQ